jgi:hypothetical protein
MMLAAAAAVTLSAATPQVLAAPDRAAVVAQYAEIASAMYDDALSTARDLARAVDALIAHPDASTLRAARAAWRNARVPYMQTEVYRFGNPIVDDWEGKVNAWPLDEGLLDYVDGSYGGQSEDNPLYVANVIGNERSRSAPTPSTPRASRVQCSPTRCTRSAAWRPTSQPATTRSSSCSGARISTAPGRATARVRGATTRRARRARTGIASGARAT